MPKSMKLTASVGLGRYQDDMQLQFASLCQSALVTSKPANVYSCKPCWLTPELSMHHPCIGPNFITCCTLLFTHWTIIHQTWYKLKPLFETQNSRGNVQDIHWSGVRTNQAVSMFLCVLITCSKVYHLHHGLRCYLISAQAFVCKCSCLEQLANW